MAEWLRNTTAGGERLQSRESMLRARGFDRLLLCFLDCRRDCFAESREERRGVRDLRCFVCLLLRRCPDGLDCCRCFRRCF